MKPEWKAFLIDAGAEFDAEQRVGSFGNPDQERALCLSGTFLCDLSHRGLIAAWGEDAAHFLQNMLSNDVRLINENQAQMTALCSPKGRMLAVFRLFQRQGTYYLELPRETLESTLKRLRLFVLRAKVSIEDADDALVRIGLAGPRASELLGERLGALPQAPGDVLNLPDIGIIRLPGPVPRYEIFGELAPMQALWQALDVHAAPVGANAWELLDILAGLPEVYPATVEAFVPQMANLDLVGGVSFKKGCYPGQEVVARMHYLGKPNRRMYAGVIDSDRLPAPGTAVHSDQMPGQEGGEIVRAAHHPDGHVRVLAVMRLGAIGGKLSLGTPDGPCLILDPGSLPPELETAPSEPTPH